MKQYMVFNIGCMECGVSSNVVGIFTDYKKAEQIKNACLIKYNWREYGQNDFQIFELPPLNKINKEYDVIL